jgi:hypothetical protein
LIKNIDTKGRIARFIAALVFLGLAIWLKSWILLAISLFIFFEAFMSWCILYQILGINHCNKK